MENLFLRKFRGVKTVKGITSLADEGCSDIQNFLIGNGLLRTRDGYSKFNHTALSGAITGLYDYKPRWGRFLLNVEGTQIRSELILYPSFVGAPALGEAPLTVYFYDVTLDWNSEITGWHWWFGDGGEATTQFPNHIYTKPGLYSVTMEVSTAYKKFPITRKNYVRVYDPDDPYLWDSDWGFDFGVGGMRYLYFDIPTITSVTPATVVEGYSATDIVVDGLNFARPDILFIGKKKCTITDNSYAAHIDATLPAGLAVGKHAGFVRNGGAYIGTAPEGEVGQGTTYKEDVLTVVPALLQLQGEDLYAVSINNGVATLIISPAASYFATDGTSVWLVSNGLREYNYSGDLLNTYEYAPGRVVEATDDSVYGRNESADTWWLERHNKSGVYQSVSASFSRYSRFYKDACSDGTNVFVAYIRSLATATNGVYKFNSSLSSYTDHSLVRPNETQRRCYGISTAGDFLWLLMWRNTSGALTETFEKWTKDLSFVSSFVTDATPTEAEGYPFIAADANFVYRSYYNINDAEDRNIKKYTHAGDLISTWSYSTTNRIRTT